MSMPWTALSRKTQLHVEKAFAVHLCAMDEKQLLDALKGLVGMRLRIREFSVETRRDLERVLDHNLRSMAYSAKVIDM